MPRLPSKSGAKGILRNPRSRIAVDVAITQDEEEAVEHERYWREEKEWIMKQRAQLEQGIQQAHADAQEFDLLHILPQHAFDHLDKDAFPLEREEFISTIMELFQGHSHVAVSKSEKIQMIGEMFDEVDASGTGDVTWDAFSSYLIKAYCAIQDKLHNKGQYYSYQLPKRYSQHLRTANLSYIEALDSYLVIGNSPVPLVHQVSLIDAASSADEPIKEIVLAKSSKTNYLAVEYIPPLKELVVSNQESSLLFYEMRRDIPHAEIYKLKRSKFVDSNHGLLRWFDRHQMLFGADIGQNQGNLMGYRFDSEDTGLLGNPLMKRKCHEAAITDVTLMHSSSFATCSLDRTVRMHDINEGRELCTLGPLTKGHQRGVLCVAFSKEHNILVSAGYEYEPIMWMPMTVYANQFIGRLRDKDSPHKSALRTVKFIPDTNQLLSFDCSGVIKVWDIRRGKVLSSFHMDHSATRSDYERYTLLAQTFNPARKSIAMIGKDHQKTQLYSWEIIKDKMRDHKKAHGTSVIKAAYFGCAHMYITFDRHNMKTWNGSRGTVQGNFSGITSPTSPIFAICLDEPGKRFFLGTATGEVTVHTYNNGTIRAHYERHNREITCIAFARTVKFGILVSCSSDGHVNVYREGVADLFPRESKLVPHKSLQLNSVPLTCALDGNSQTLIIGTDKEEVLVYAMSLGAFATFKGRCTRRSKKRDSHQSKETSPRHMSLTLCGTLPILITEHSQEDGMIAELDSTVNGYKNPPFAEITSLVHMHPFAAFVCADSNGCLTIWSTPPAPNPYRALNKWMFSEKAMIVHLAMVTEYAILIGADDVGMIYTWDITSIIDSCHLDWMGEDFDPSMHNRHDERGSTKSKKVEDMCRNIEPVLIKSWVAHDAQISSMYLVPGQLFILTGHDDGSASLWSTDGVHIGDLCQGQGDIGSPPMEPFGFDQWRASLDAEAQAIVALSDQNRIHLWNSISGLSSENGGTLHIMDSDLLARSGSESIASSAGVLRTIRSFRRRTSVNIGLPDIREDSSLGDQNMDGYINLQGKVFESLATLPPRLSVYSTVSAHSPPTHSESLDVLQSPGTLSNRPYSPIADSVMQGISPSVSQAARCLSASSRSSAMRANHSGHAGQTTIIEATPKKDLTVKEKLWRQKSLNKNGNWGKKEESAVDVMKGILESDSHQIHHLSCFLAKNQSTSKKESDPIERRKETVKRRKRTKSKVRKDYLVSENGQPIGYSNTYPSNPTPMPRFTDGMWRQVPPMSSLRPLVLGDAIPKGKPKEKASQLKYEVSLPRI